MSEFTGENIFSETVYLVEQTDLVLGGPDGTANKAIKELTERTNWLKKGLQGFAGVTLVSANKTLSTADVLYNLVVINSNFESIECVLPALTNSDAGLKVSLVAYNVSKQVSINSGTSNNIVIGSSNRQRLYMGNSDSLELVWLGSAWMVLEAKGNFSHVGGFEYGYSQLPNTLIADGTLLNRSDYPRLWEYVNALSAGLISDFSWSSVPGNKGFFSTGNSTTTFRIPDLRSMFIRGLDLGAGITFGRNTDAPGGYEPDEFKQHTHSVTPDDRSGTSDNANDRNVMIPGGNGRAITTSAAGGTETRPKNIGLIPLIKI